jgi:methylated-DNA-[protein]-cysteine S-methyltransferase
VTTIQDDADTIVLFNTALGWMAMVGAGEALKRLTFGHESPEAALDYLGPVLRVDARVGSWNRPLVKRLRAYARGAKDDFKDVVLELGKQTEFQRKVRDCCRRVAYGRTSSYGELALAAGYPRAARAVGSCMAGNPVGLIIPCHRILASGGRLGGYSVRQGTSMKERLLRLEAATARPAASRRLRPQRATRRSSGRS